MRIFTKLYLKLEGFVSKGQGFNVIENLKCFIGRRLLKGELMFNMKEL